MPRLIALQGKIDKPEPIHHTLHFSRGSLRFFSAWLKNKLSGRRHKVRNPQMF